MDSIHVLIDGKEILPQALYHEEVVKGVLMGLDMNVEPNSMQAPNETTFLATYAAGHIS